MAVTLESRFSSNEVERVLAAYNGTGLLFGANSLTVGQLLAHLPDRFELLRRGASDVRDTLAAAQAVHEAQDAFERAMALNDRAAALEASQAMSRASRSERAVVDGTLDGSVFTVSNGTKISPVVHTGLSVAPGDHVWAILHAMRTQDATSFFHASWIGTYETVYLPRYGSDSLVACFARSRLARLLLLALQWPEDHSPELVEKIRALLWCAHCPPSRQSASNIDNPEFVSALHGYFDEVLDVDSSDEDWLAPPEFPAPRLVKTARQAEEYAAEVMIALGFPDATPTITGADGGIDVLAHDAVAQVKMEATPTGRPTLQALGGIASLERKSALFFSLAGYTAQAVEWAERAGIACFEFAFDGTVEAVSSSARRLLDQGHH